MFSSAEFRVFVLHESKTLMIARCVIFKCPVFVDRPTLSHDSFYCVVLVRCLWNYLPHRGYIFHISHRAIDTRCISVRWGLCVSSDDAIVCICSYDTKISIILLSRL